MPLDHYFQGHFMKSIRVYLAGPEVFLNNEKEISQAKKTLCRKYGFEGVFPLDKEVDIASKSSPEIGFCISASNEDLIKTCDLLVANITPFRGPSADVGTAYEVGFAHALCKKVFAYTNITERFTERTSKALNSEVARGKDGKLRDSRSMLIEEMELTDNLMLDGCVHASSNCLVVEQAPAEQMFTFLGGFEKCLRIAQKSYKTKQ
jgi:nucleoside 2-deoxyribosyltransferase